MQPYLMTAVLILTIGFFCWTAFRRWRQLRVGAPDPYFTLAGGELGARIRDTVIYAFGQKRMPAADRYRWAGIAHIMIFGGFIVLLLNSVKLWGRGYDPNFDFWGVLAHDAPLGIGYGLIKDTFVLLVLLGSAVFIYYRTIHKQRRMTLGTEGLVILGIIVTMMIGDLLYYGAWFNLQWRLHGEEPQIYAEWLGSLTAFALSGIESDQTLWWLAATGWFVHSTLVLIFLNILPFSKHFHIITAIPNVFLRDSRKRGTLPKVEDLEGKIEREEAVGINKLEDLSWKNILDLYTCTECGRCSDNCPAYTTDKKLSPKHLTLALRDHLYDTEDAMFGVDDPVTKATKTSIEEAQFRGRKQGSDEGREELHTNPPAPADGYFVSHEPVELVPNIVHPDVLWACTTCRACEEHCPVMISYVDKIVDMRRDLVMVKGEMPPELQRPFMGMETNGNPWNQSAMDRAKWSDGLDIPLLGDKPDAEVIYWVGCAASYDNRAQKTAKAVARLLGHAGVDFAILGTEETCTGDPARRAGNEYLFQMLCEQNVETLNGYGADKKTIITACPHCFNTLANEYPDFGGKFDVVHHSEFLMGLVAQKRLVPEKPVEGKVAFHDSCYLGRYNDVYEAPRKVLESIPGVELVEVPYWNKSRGLCCGAGGAQMWMEEQNQNRVNVKRTLQLVDTGCSTIASGCPFCMTMLTDGLKAQEKEEEIAQLDIAEMLERSVVFSDERSAVAAE